MLATAIVVLAASAGLQSFVENTHIDAKNNEQAHMHWAADWK